MPCTYIYVWYLSYLKEKKSKNIRGGGFKTRTSCYVHKDEMPLSNSTDKKKKKREAYKPLLYLYLHVARNQKERICVYPQVFPNAIKSRPWTLLYAPFSLC